MTTTEPTLAPTAGWTAICRTDRLTPDRGVAALVDGAPVAVFLLSDGATYAIGTPGHSWQLVAQGKSPAAHKGMEHAAKVMASTAVDLFRDPALIEATWADFRERLAGTPFVNPIPDDVDPPVSVEASRVESTAP